MATTTPIRIAMTKAVSTFPRITTIIPDTATNCPAAAASTGNTVTTGTMISTARRRLILIQARRWPPGLSQYSNRRMWNPPIRANLLHEASFRIFSGNRGGSSG
jgi:hypothetical protein